MKEFLKLKQDLFGVLSSSEEFQLCSRMFKGCSKFQGCFNEVLRMFQGRVLRKSFKEVSRLFQGNFKSVSRKFQGNFRGVSRESQGCFK